jgi:hypothetical protein
VAQATEAKKAKGRTVRRGELIRIRRYWWRHRKRSNQESRVGKAGRTQNQRSGRPSSRTWPGVRNPKSNFHCTDGGHRDLERLFKSTGRGGARPRTRASHRSQASPLVPARPLCPTAPLTRPRSGSP